MGETRAAQLRAAFEAAPPMGEALAAAIVEHTNDAIIAATFDGTIVYWNRGAEALYGYTADEVVGTPISVLLPFDLGGESQTALVEMAHGAWVKPFETVHRGKDGSPIAVSITVSAVWDRTGQVVCASMVARGVAAGPDSGVRMAYNALHDRLTGLPSRALGEDRLAACLQESGRRPASIAVLFVDLDHFKDINDLHGHRIGDQVLREAGERLQSVLRPVDQIYRYGGDEFIIVCPQMADANQALSVADRVARVVRLPMPIDDGPSLRITASVGVAIGQPDDTPAELIHYADLAMYKAKDAGRARVELFDDSLEAKRLHPRTRLQILTLS